MTIYADIADAVLSFLPTLPPVGGTSWTVYRTTGDSIHAATTTATDDEPRTMNVLRNNPDKRQRSGAETPIYSTDWLGYAALRTDIQVDDILVSGALAFLVAGIDTDEGMLVAALTAVPA
jgi:hypothetical protein